VRGPPHPTACRVFEVRASLATGPFLRLALELLDRGGRPRRLVRAAGDSPSRGTGRAIAPAVHLAHTCCLPPSTAT